MVDEWKDAELPDVVFRENLRHPSQLDEWMGVPTLLRYSVPG